MNPPFVGALVKRRPNVAHFSKRRAVHRGASPEAFVAQKPMRPLREVDSVNRKNHGGFLMVKI